MEPLSALGVAASVAQFIQFGCSLVSKTREIYKSAQGTSIQYADLENATKRLVVLHEQLDASQQIKKDGVRKESETLEAIHTNCMTIAAELLSRLNKLKIHNHDKYRPWKSFRQALKCVFSKGEIDAMAEKLRSYQKELDGHILMSLSEKFNNLTILQDENFAALDKNLQQSVSSLLETLISIHKKVEQVLGAQQMPFRQTLSDRRPNEAEKVRKLANSVNESLLCSLRFSTMRNRHEEIPEAHQKTFSWIFQPPELHTRPWSDFPKWLREDGGMYWVNGKAGSGKSTLMRYIYDHSKTREHVEFWTGYENLDMAAYFFWNSGAVEQRSQSGVLRSLLFEILRKRRDLIRLVFEKPWNEYYSLIQGSDEDDEKINVKPFEWKWSFATLQQAFTRLASLTNSHGFKLCFFVDGLDECDGDQQLMADYFRKISILPNVKICVSSRPGLIFEDAFEGCHGLRLQDLTRNDMRTYIHDTLAANPRMKRLSLLDPGAASRFIMTAETKANGVFIWVTLVIKSLLNGLRNQDSISDLQMRLESLPSDLNSFYCLILNRIDNLYIEQASRIFQIYDRASDLNLRMSVLELELAVTAKLEDGIKGDKKVISTDEINMKCEKMSAHLKSRCEGLLEVHELIDRQWDSFDDIDMDSNLPRVEQDEDTLESIRERARTKADLKISYLHRTVKDFLKTDFVRQKLRNETISLAKFDPNLSLLASYVINLKHSISSLYYDITNFSWNSRLLSFVRDALVFAMSVNDKAERARDLLLHELYNLGQQWWQYKSLSPDPNLVYQGSDQREAEWCQNFMSMAVYFGLTSFVDRKLRQWIAVPSGPYSEPLLAYALDMSQPVNPLSRVQTRHLILPKMINTILRHGGDPNIVLPRGNVDKYATIWETLLKSTRCVSMLAEQDLDQLKRKAEVFIIMLKNGADPFATQTTRDMAGPSSWRVKEEQYGVADVIIDAFADYLPKETMILYEILQQINSTRSSNIGESSLRDPETNGKRPWNAFCEGQEKDSRIVINLIEDEDEEETNACNEIEMRRSHQAKRAKLINECQSTGEFGRNRRYISIDEY